MVALRGALFPPAWYDQHPTDRQAPHSLGFGHFSKVSHLSKTVTGTKNGICRLKTGGRVLIAAEL